MAYLPPPSATPLPGLADIEDGTDDESRKRRDFKTRFMDRVRAGRHEVLRGFLENCLFYLGLQWLQPMPDGRGFVRANLRRDVPRPVTNRFKAILDAIDAPVSRLEPAISFVPGTSKDDDVMTAELADKVFDYIGSQVQLDRIKGDLSKIIVTCNNGYLHGGLDPTGGGTIRIPKWACPTCGASMSASDADECGAVCQKDQTPLRPSKTEGDTVNEGALFLEATTPFETWVDYGVPRMDDQPIVMIRRLRSRAWCEATFPDQAAEIRKLPSASTTSDIGITFLQSLIRLAPGSSPTMGGIGFGAPIRWQDSILDDLLYVKPCSEFPEGLMQRMLGNDLEVDVKNLGDVANDGTPEEPGAPFIPVVHFGYDNVPGTHLCTGPADHLKDLQRQRNRREAAIELYFQRMANGIWLIPEGTDVQTPSGEEGWVMRWSPLGAGGAKPERVEGNRLPSSFVEWLQFTDKQMEDIAGTYDIFRGERPPNVSSGYAMQILSERAQSRFAHLFANYEVGYQAMASMLFLLFRNHAPDTIYIKIRGEDDRWAVRALERADLRGGIDVRVESGSARPKSSLEKKAATEQVLSIPGMVDVTDPDVRFKILNLYGVPELMASTKADDEQIRREHAIYLAWVQAITDPATGLPYEGLTPEQMMLPVLVDPLLDNHPLHAARHRIFQLSPEFLGTPDWARKAFREGHHLEHLYEEQMDVMQQAMAGAPPAPPGPPSEGGPGDGGGSGAGAGAARAQGQAQAMQAGGRPPGPSAQSQQPNAEAMNAQ